MTEPAPPPPTPPSRPKNAVVILLDSLNRHMLGSYGGTEFATPNLDAFAKGALKFEKHYTGWDYLRGHEGDTWKTCPDPSWTGAPSFGRPWLPYDQFARLGLV